MMLRSFYWRTIRLLRTLAGYSPCLTPHSRCNAACTACHKRGNGMHTTTYTVHDTTDFDAFVATFMSSPAATAFFIQNVLSLNVDVQVKTYNLARASLSSGVCLLWDINVVYDLSAHGVIYTHLVDDFNTCVAGWQTPSPLMFLAIAIILLAFLQQFTITRNCV